MSVFNVHDFDFEEKVLKSDIPVLVDFWASWCGPCRMLSPIVDEVAQENEGKLAVAKINVDEQPDLAMTYNVASIPTLILFKNGEIAASSIGVKPKEAILAMLK